MDELLKKNTASYMILNIMQYIKYCIFILAKYRNYTYDMLSFQDVAELVASFLTQSEVDWLLRPGPPDPIRPGEHPREWTSRQGLPVGDPGYNDQNFDEDVLKFATPMLPGESVREWAERVGYSPLKVDEIVAEWQNKM